MGLLDWVRSPSAAGLVGLAALGRGSGPEGRRVGGRVGGRGRRGGAGAYALRQEVLSLMSGSGARSPRSGALRGVGSKAGYRGPPAPEVEARAS